MEYTELRESNMERVIPLYIDYYNHAEGGAWTPDTVYRRVHQVVTREDSYGLLLADGARVLGFAMGYFEQYDDGKAYDLVEIVIARPLQRQGLGSLFMRELETRVRAMGAMLIQLQAVNDDRHNRFYGNLGYKNCGNLVIKSKIL